MLKKCLKRSIGVKQVSFIELQTLVLEVEVVLNNRPLCKDYDDDLEEEEPLEDTDDGLMNVNVKERRQYLLEMLNNAPVIKPRFTNGTLDPKATMSRIGRKDLEGIKTKHKR